MYLSPIASELQGPVELGPFIGMVPLDCTMTSISVFADSPLGLGTSAVYTLRTGTSITALTLSTSVSDLSDRSLTCTMVAGSQACSATGSVSIAALSLFDLKVVTTGAAPLIHHALVQVVCQ